MTLIYGFLPGSCDEHGLDFLTHQITFPKQSGKQRIKPVSTDSQSDEMFTLNCINRTVTKIELAHDVCTSVHPRDQYVSALQLIFLNVTGID